MYISTLARERVRGHDDKIMHPESVKLESVLYCFSSLNSLCNNNQS